LMPTHGPGLVRSCICNRAYTTSMFAFKSHILDTQLTDLREQENLTAFSQSRTVASGTR
ncbi:hypothetical protein K438DRAFT_1419747, partial [Mycena galopus ATCC 62051]